MTARETIAGGIVALVGFAAIAAGWVKAIVAWLRGFLVVSVWVNEDVLRALTSYLNAVARRTGGPKAYAAETRYMQAHGHGEIIPFEEMDRASSSFWLRRRPVWVTRAEKPLMEHHLAFKLSVLRGTIDAEALIADACAWASEDFKNALQRHRVIHHHGRSLTMDGQPPTSPSKLVKSVWTMRGRAVRLIRHEPSDIEPPLAVETLDSMVMTREVRALTDDIRRWFRDRAWCAEHGIPWRAGYLYEGEPGSGKTSHARSLAVELDLPIHVFDLATMNNEDLRTSWLRMAADAPCVALIEDVDRVFDGDRNVAPQSGLLTSGGLTFNALLNAIDGIDRHDGVLLIVTTNHLDKVDPALRNRKGRIDGVVHFGTLDFDSRAVLARRIVDDPALAEQLAADHGDAPISAFVATCCLIARAARYGTRAP
jgi:ATPase family associated with various cellular activities (AAA)